MARLLVSVRSAAEAIDAVAGGADIIDVKEPNRGALGRADNQAVQSVIDAVGDSVPVSMACGELVDLPNGSTQSPTNQSQIPRKLAYAKIGLAGCVSTDVADWKEKWKHWVTTIPTAVQPIAVIYADASNAGSPTAADIIELSQQFNCQGILIDTFRKQKHRSLFDWQTESEIVDWIDAAHNGNQFVAIAGSLTAEHFSRVLRMQADIIAIRGAACKGDRDGEICKQKICDLSNILASKKPMHTSVHRRRIDAHLGIS